MTMHLLRKAEIVHRANDSQAKLMIVSSNALLDVGAAIPRFETVEREAQDNRSLLCCFLFQRNASS